jgi:hypothetical protein
MNSEKEEIEKLRRKKKLLDYAILAVTILWVLVFTIILFDIGSGINRNAERIENLKMDYDNFSDQVAKGIVDYTLSDEFLLGIQDSIAKLGVLSSNTFISFIKGCCKGLCCCGIGR